MLKKFILTKQKHSCISVLSCLTVAYWLISYLYTRVASKVGSSD